MVQKRHAATPAVVFTALWPTAVGFDDSTWYFLMGSCVSSCLLPVMFWNEIFLNPEPWKESLAQGLAKNAIIPLNQIEYGFGV